MPECFKTYEVCYGSDTQYTQSVNRMRHWLEDAGGLLYRGRLIDVGKHVTYDNTLEFYKNTYRTSVDRNPSSTVPNGDTPPGEKGFVFLRPTRTQKDQAGVVLAREMIYKTIG